MVVSISFSIIQTYPQYRMAVFIFASIILRFTPPLLFIVYGLYRVTEGLGVVKSKFWVKQPPVGFCGMYGTGSVKRYGV